MPEALASLTKKLGLLQAPGKDAAQQWARRTRELQAPLSAEDLDFFDRIHLLDQAAIKAASEKFPAEFKATSYDYGPPPIAEILVTIEALPPAIAEPPRDRSFFHTLLRYVLRAPLGCLPEPIESLVDDFVARGL